ncbi:hypothetical protein NBRC116494_19780 [Aurantivibrio plasticivorans]
MLHITRKELGLTVKPCVSKTLSVATLMMLSGMSLSAFAANECRIEYGYHTGSGFNRQDKVKRVYLDVNETKTINQSKLNYVKNLKDNKATFYLTGVSDITLDKNSINPLVGFYLTPVRLDKVRCLNQTTQSFNAPEALIQAFKQANKTASQIAEGLNDTFNLGGQQIAQLLRAANYSANQVAKALQDTFNASAQQIGGWMKAAGYTGAQVISAVKNVVGASVQTAARIAKQTFNAAGATVAAWLKGAGYAARDIAQALQSELNASAQQVATWLKAAGYTGSQVIGAIKQGVQASAQVAADIASSVFNAGAQTAAQWMKAAGYTAEQIAASVISAYNMGAAQVAEVLKAVGYSGAQVIAAIKQGVQATAQTAAAIAQSVFNASAQTATQWMKAAGYTAAQIASGLASAYNMTAAQIAQGMEAVGYSTGQIVAALKSGINTSANEMAALLKQMGVTKENAERAMRSAGYTARQIAAAIASVWNEAGRATGKVVDNAARVVKNPTTIGVKINCVLGAASHVCKEFSTKKTPEGTMFLRYQLRQFDFELKGLNFQGVTSVSGLPGRVSIRKKTPTNMIIRVTSRYTGQTWQGATTGIAHLMVNGRRVAGGEFRWTVIPERYQSQGTGVRVVGGSMGSRTTNSGSNNSQTSSKADLKPESLMNHWSYKSSVTKYDSRGGSYVYHSVDPSFCSTGMTTHTSNNTEGSGLLGSYQRRNFTLPAVIGVNVRNQGSAASGSSDVKMKSGNQVVGETALPAVQAGQTFNVSIPRPSNYNRSKCVVRGGGLSNTGCYACLYDSGEDGDLLIEVDSNNSVQESNENNNSALFN